MSLKAMTCAMALRGVTASEKLLLLALANYADEDMTCFPSQKRLAEDACLSPRTVLSLLSDLEERRMISRERRHRSDGSRTSDSITLHFFGGLGEVVAPPPEAIAVGVVKPLQGGGEMVAPLTSFEPVNEPVRNEGPDLAETIWQEANQDSRNRSGRPAVRRAVSAALNKGATPESLLLSVRTHCRKSGEHAKGLHRIIEGELWRDCIAKPHPPPTETDPAYRAHLEAHFRATGEWKPEWGERPRIAA